MGAFPGTAGVIDTQSFATTNAGNLWSFSGGVAEVLDFEVTAFIVVFCIKVSDDRSVSPDALPAHSLRRKPFRWTHTSRNDAPVPHICFRENSPHNSGVGVSTRITNDRICSIEPEPFSASFSQENSSNGTGELSPLT